MNTASLENALSILKGGSILSAVKERSIPVEQLKSESVYKFIDELLV